MTKLDFFVHVIMKWFTLFDHYLITLQNVIDGDVCEMFNSIDISKQKGLSEELDRTPSEVWNDRLAAET